MPRKVKRCLGTKGLLNTTMKSLDFTLWSAEKLGGALRGGSHMIRFILKKDYFAMGVIEWNRARLDEERLEKAFAIMKVGTGGGGHN